MRTIEHYEKRAGGKGTMHIERLLQGEQLGDQITMFAKVTIDVDSSIGVHTHHDDCETYYILSGTGRYYDNDLCYDVKAEDVLFCPKHSSHGLENTGSEPLVFIAMIRK